VERMCENTWHYLDVLGNSNCRLCGGETALTFRKVLLQKHEVSFLKCQRCLSLQTEAPYWLDEAYADDRPLSDCGMVARTIELCAKTDLILSILRVGHDAVGVDIGGSLGLFSRMMRDRGYNFHRSDKYSRNFYVPFHDATENGIARASVVTSFEVMEHLSNPQEELHSMFALSPDVVLATTMPYTDQASDWWYYAPDIGQHVFFYSPKALQAIAACYGMQLISAAGIHLFFREKPQTLSYDIQDLHRLAGLLNNPQHLHIESMQLLLSRLSDPYQWASKDYAEILGRMRTSAECAA
jgi:hypothetical protein